MPVRIALVDRVVGGIGIAVGADARVAHIPPVGREEAAEGRIVIAGVEVGQAGFRVGALADTPQPVPSGTRRSGGATRGQAAMRAMLEWPLRLGWAERHEHRLHLLAIGLVDFEPAAQRQGLPVEGLQARRP